MPDESDLAKEVVKEVSKAALREAWEKKSRVLAWLKSLIPWLTPPDDRTPGILILGPGGTGKTTLAQFLSGDVAAILDPPGFYEPSVSPEKFNLAGDMNAEVVVMPGQGNRLERDFDRLAMNLKAGQYRGVIFVADFGHHAIESESIRGHKLYKGNKAAFLKDLLTEQRREELELLDRLVPILKQVERKLWLLVVVLKQDLWSGEQSKVTAHYQEGEWSKQIDDLVQCRGSERMLVQTVCTSLHILNYTTLGGSQLLKKNTPGYDANRQRQSIHDLLRCFDAIREWEERS